MLYGSKAAELKPWKKDFFIRFRRKRPCEPTQWYRKSPAGKDQMATQSSLALAGARTGGYRETLLS